MAHLRCYPQIYKGARCSSLMRLAMPQVLKTCPPPPSNHLEKLSGDLAGFFSIRINAKYRIVFRFDTNAHDVAILDYH